MIIFKELQKQLKKVEGKLLISQTEEDIKRWKEKREYLKKVESYIKEGEWLGYGVSKEKLRYYIETGCSYERTAEHFETTVPSVKTSLWRMAKKVEEVVDRGVIENIMELEVEDLKEIKVKERQILGELETTILSSVLEELPKGKRVEGVVDINKYKKELMFLQMYSEKKMRSYLNKIDKENMSELLGLLGCKGEEYEKKLALKYIRGEIKKWEELEKYI